MGFVWACSMGMYRAPMCYADTVLTLMLCACVNDEDRRMLVGFVVCVETRV